MTGQALVPLILLVVMLLGGTLMARRLGYKMCGAVVVRCLNGHLFTTIWVPGASLKAIRLGWVRLRRCPVGDHLTIVSPVRDSDLTVEERRVADQNRDVRIP
jgi:hypothetical protein